MSKIKNGIDYFGVDDNSVATEYVTKFLEIGDWNMDSTASITVAHGLSSTEWKNIRNVQAIIRDDDDAIYYIVLLDGGGGLNSNAYINYFDSTNIYLSRKTSGFYDNTTFNATSYNRGFISFIYTPI